MTGPAQPTPPPFSWVSDVARGAWLQSGLGSTWDNELRRSSPALGATVPGGFDALIRVLPPLTRDRPAHGTWASFEDSLGAPEIQEETVSWREAAEAHGSELRPGSLSHQLLGRSYGDQAHDDGPDGWRYHTPNEGELPSSLLSAIAGVLRGHTDTPGRGVVGVWEGFDGLVSSNGVRYFAMVEASSSLPRFLAGMDAKTGSGTLPAEIAQGPKLQLPDRDYFCFAAGINDFVTEQWLDRAPWLNRVEPFPEERAPTLIWPEDRAWFMVNEIDFDSTLIACSRSCADSLLAAGGVEAVEITRDTPLWTPIDGSENQA